jgi:hypothetical protein
MKRLERFSLLIVMGVSLPLSTAARQTRTATVGKTFGQQLPGVSSQAEEQVTEVSVLRSGGAFPGSRSLRPAQVRAQQLARRAGWQICDLSISDLRQVFNPLHFLAVVQRYMLA